MKKIFTILVLVGITSIAFGQRSVDLSVELYKPTTGTNIYNDVDFPLHWAIVNNGPDEISVGDTVLFQMSVGSSALGGLYYFVIDTAVASGGKKYRSFNFKLSGITQDINNATFCMNAVLVNRPASNNFQNLITDAVTTNNAGCTTVNFKAGASSTEDLVGLSNYSFYPNPAATILNINYDINGNSPVAIKMYDMNGKMVVNNTRTNSMGSHVYQLDVSAISEGIYILEIAVNNEVIRERVVIAR